MSKVSVTKDKLDILANAIANKSGEPLTLTLDEMVSAVDGIETGGGGITPTGNIDITQAGVTDVTNYATATVPSGETVGQLILPSTPNITVYSSTGEIVVTHYAEDNIDPIYEGGWIEKGQLRQFITYGDKNYQLPTQGATTITPTTSQQTAVTAGKYTTGAITVAAMPTGTATAPTTISGTAATVSTGTNTLTLSKTVSNTPQVTAGYVASGTAGNSSVSLTANVTTKGTATITPTTSNQTIASGTYITGTQTISGDANLVAGNIKSGTTIFGVTGTYSGGGTSKNVQVLQSTSRTNAASLTKVLGDLTVSKTGTYDVYWSGGRTNTSTSYTWGTRLYIDGTGYGTENTTWTNNCQSNHLSNVSLTANQKLSVYARGRSGSYYTFAPMLAIVEA